MTEVERVAPEKEPCSIWCRHADMMIGHFRGIPCAECGWGIFVAQDGGWRHVNPDSLSHDARPENP